MKKIIVILTYTLLHLNLKSQDFNDTIISTNADTIICKIGLVNNHNIFYEFNPKKKKVVSTYIDRRKVEYFSLSSSDVIVLEQVNPEKKEEKKEGEGEENFTNHKELFTENNGIIYPSIVNKPPRFQNGINDLRRYLEINVKVRPIDIRVFGTNYVIILYSLTIDSTGAVSRVEIMKSSTTTGGYSYDSRFLETEIRNVLSRMPAWTSPIVNGRKSSLNIYLPLKFKLEQNSVIMYSAKNSFVFKNRK